MPPKKPGKGDKKKTVKSTAFSGPSAPEVISDQSKEFYIVQIKDLNSRIEKYQKLCDELEVKNKEYRAQFDQLTDDKKDIVLFIKKKLDEKTDDIQDLHEQIRGLQQTKDAERDAFEQQLQQLRTEYQETRDQLTSENMILSGKLASLEDFKVQREELVARTQALEQALIDEDLAHKDTMYQVERKQVIAKDRLKKDMITRVNHVAAEFRKASNRQMAETTKRTIRENIVISTQMSKMSERTEELIEENNELRERDRKQRQQLSLLEEEEKALARRNASNQKVIRSLTEKLNEQKVVLEEFKKKENNLERLEATVESLHQELTDSIPEMTALTREKENLEERLAHTKRENVERSMSRERIEKTLTDAADALRAVLMSTADGSDFAQTADDVTAARNGLLESLLMLLNGAADCDRASHQRGGRSGSAPSRRMLDERYQLGDAGLVPRPGQHISSNTEKMKVLEDNQAKTLRRVSNKSMSTQTASATKAVFFADQLLCKYPSKSTQSVTTLPSLQTNLGRAF